MKAIDSIIGVGWIVFWVDVLFAADPNVARALIGDSRAHDIYPSRPTCDMVIACIWQGRPKAWWRWGG